MIPEAYIVDWKRCAPWQTDSQVEQDLILSRLLLELYKDQMVSENLIFRGGTALYKLFLKPPARYSEDIDMVQNEAAAIGKVMDAIKKICGSWLSQPKTKQKRNSVVFTFQQDSEIPPTVSMRIKIEINTREHFTVFGNIKKKFSLQSDWINGEVPVNTYSLEELLSTKLRALYQRNKGRDLFDLWYGLVEGEVDPGRVIDAFRAYMSNQGLRVSKKEFKNNLELKLYDHSFKADIVPLLRPDISYSIEDAYRLVDEKLISRL